MQDTNAEPHDRPILMWSSQAVLDVAAERRRQIDVEGWTPDHDDQHGDNSMSIVAACYALVDIPALEVQTLKLRELWLWTGWSTAWFKPKTRRANLIRAAALLVAEIERIDRHEPPSGKQGAPVPHNPSTLSHGTAP